ncbi:MAG: GPMC system MBL fold metallohydrolase [Deltaproteobacteria bacterium]|nr:GPMC system MBL fold metallohydrolase [Deltaproteobacteria bacterium]
MAEENATIKVTILGSGTSTGVPAIGCDCPVCSSHDPRDKRTRASILLTLEGANVLIDTSTDLRYQALKNGIKRLSAVFFTHAHADHVHGIDELRSFNFLQQEAIPCYGDKETLKRIKTMFAYIFREQRHGGGIPKLTLHEMSGDLQLLGRKFIPVEVLHGELPVLGYRVANMAYVTDCSEIGPASMEKLRGLDLLILGALRHRPHATHFSLSEALEVVEALKPRRTLFTHMGHEVSYIKTSAELPEGVELAYDGMTAVI